MAKHVTLVASAAVLGGAVSSLAATQYDDNVRATYTKQTYSSAGSVVDVTFKGFSQYGTKVRSDVCRRALGCSNLLTLYLGRS